MAYDNDKYSIIHWKSTVIKTRIFISVLDDVNKEKCIRKCVGSCIRCNAFALPLFSETVVIDFEHEFIVLVIAI